MTVYHVIKIVLGDSIQVGSLSFPVYTPHVFSVYMCLVLSSYTEGIEFPCIGPSSQHRCDSKRL